MRVVRNQIVHNGGEANKYKSMDDMDLAAGDAGYLDMEFSEKYPEYVSGSGVNAGVNVTQEQLQSMIESSVALVGWLAKELRAREASSLEKSKGIQ